MPRHDVFAAGDVAEEIRAIAGVVAVEASTSKPSGAAVTESPCDIQTAMGWLLASTQTSSFSWVSSWITGSSLIRWVVFASRGLAKLASTAVSRP